MQRGRPRRHVAEPPHVLGPVRVGQPVQRQDDQASHWVRRPGAQPINLDETTYDEVYGRIGMFKIGVGYRTTPRTEGVFNFVWSSSDAEEEASPDRHGGHTRGPARRPFHRVQVSGASRAASGGSSRARASRRSSATSWASTGTRTSAGRSSTCPANVTPGLAAQDGKFFEKSWALSLGPTGGVLVGVGPVEVMAETQIRFMGGLSDVDWLVEEGLRDINSESSRWSLPILFGARIRF